MMIKNLGRAGRAVRAWFAGEGQEGVTTHADETAAFVLEINDLQIGTLSLRQSEWEFSYSDAFRAQLGKPDSVQPLVAFPDATKAYKSADLWPFFTARIPSLSQPRVKARLKDKDLDATSWAQLLKEFGGRTIANPFVLRPI